MHMCTQVCVDKYHFCLVSARGPVRQGTASLTQRTAPQRRCQVPPLARTADTCMPPHACRTVTALYTGLTSGFCCLPLPSLSSGQHSDAVRGRHALQDPGGEVHLPAHVLHLACAFRTPCLRMFRAQPAHPGQLLGGLRHADTHETEGRASGSALSRVYNPARAPLVPRLCAPNCAFNWMHPPANTSHPLATLPPMQPEYKRADVSPCVSARAAPSWASLPLVAALVMGVPCACAARVLGVKLPFVPTPSVAAPPPQMRHLLSGSLIFQSTPAPVRLQPLVRYRPALKCSCCADLRLQHHFLHFPQAQAQGGMNGGLGQAGRQTGGGKERKAALAA